MVNRKQKITGDQIATVLGKAELTSSKIEFLLEIERSIEERPRLFDTSLIAALIKLTRDESEYVGTKTFQILATMTEKNLLRGEKQIGEALGEARSTITNTQSPYYKDPCLAAVSFVRAVSKKSVHLISSEFTSDLRRIKNENDDSRIVEELERLIFEINDKKPASEVDADPDINLQKITEVLRAKRLSIRHKVAKPN